MFTKTKIEKIYTYMYMHVAEIMLCNIHVILKFYNGYKNNYEVHVE